MLSPLEVERGELGYHVEEVRGKSLRVVRRAHPSSECCVFLVHGGGGRAGQFKHQIRALETKTSVVAVDFLGHGDSPKPNEPRLYTADEHLADLLCVYERHKRRRNVFVAHCYGAVHTLRLLARLREGGSLGEEVAGVVLLALGTTVPVSAGLLLRLPAFVLEWLRPLARSTSNATIFTPTSDPALIEFENAISDGNRMYVMKVLGQDCSSQPAWDGWLDTGKNAITSSSVPVAMICGSLDGVFSIASCGDVRDHLGVKEDDFHVVEGAGHLTMLERPDLVSRLIQDFITAHP